MRNTRAKKLRIETSKYLLGPFDESLIQIQLDKNEKCIQQISKDNFDKAHELLKQIKADTEMISSYNREKYVLKSLAMNTEAYLYLKQLKYEPALKCLEEAEALQTQQESSPIDMARTKLNKSVVLSHLDKHQKAIELAKEALELLKHRKDMEFFQLRKNQYKLYEIMTISFYNIAVELSHISELIEAGKVYKEGYYLAQKTLGPHHKLTLLLKNIVKKKDREISKSREREDSIARNKSDHKLVQSAQTYLIPSNEKEKELKRIYASKKKSHTIAATKQKDSKKELDYYLKSLERIKGMYSKNKRNSRNTHFYTTNRQSEDEHFSQIREARKMVTESQNSAHRYAQGNLRVKDIILNGKPISKNGYFISSIPEVKERRTAKKEDKNLEKKHCKTEEAIHLEPIAAKEPQKEVTLHQIAKKVQQKHQEDSQACQLI